MQHRSGEYDTTTQILFLQLLAKDCPTGLHFLVAKKTDWIDSESGRPRTGFPAEAWREQALRGPWYFSTGASDSHKSRKRENIKSLRAIVIDDVGTKVAADDLKAAPTWILETSEGNFQYGYLLKTWTDDIDAGDALMMGLVEAGLQDAAVNTCCRLFRIPGSANTKPGKNNFTAALRHIDESVTYTLHSLAKAFKVKPKSVLKSLVDTGERPAAGVPDPVFDWLRDRGMVRHEASGGWWEISCPWPAEHTTDTRTEARFMPLSASMIGCSQVQCKHTHGTPEPAFRRRFFEWVIAQGGPDPITVGKLDEHTRSVLREVFNDVAAQNGTAPQVRTQAPEEPEGMFTFGTLAKAIGVVPVTALLRADRVRGGGYARNQPCTYDNVEAGLRALGIQVRLNLMNGKTSYILPERIDMARFGAKSILEVDGMIDAALCDVFYTAGLREKNNVRDCLARIANSQYWHPAKDWIESKPWDGQDRFDALASSIQTKDADAWRMYLHRWLLQGVEAACGWAVRRESQKALVLVLAGRQGIGKTRWLMSLAPRFCAEGKHLNLDGSTARDSKHEALQGMIVELGELDTTFRKSAVGSLKAFVSATTDEYRLPYAEGWLTRPRCTSFCGSVNEHHFLQDVTGNRRFAAVWALKCDPTHGVDMQQLWAQMHTLWAGGEQWWFTSQEEEEQFAGNEGFQSIDGITEQVVAEIERRKNRNFFPLECSLTQSDVTRLMGLHYEQTGILARVGMGLRKGLGEARNLRKRGGRAGTWSWWVTHAEADSLGIKPLRPPVLLPTK